MADSAQTPATQSAMTSWQNDMDQTNNLKTTQLANQQQRLENLLALMGQVPASVAFNLLIPAAMLMVSNQNTTDMEIQASKGNEESDILTLINITQADNNYLASNSAAYQNASNAEQPNDPTYPPIYNGTNPDGTPHVMTNQEFIDQYNTKYDEANDAQNDLITIFETTNSDGTSYYDSNYATSMIASINSWQAATNDLSSPQVGDPSLPTGSDSDAYYYSVHMQDYANDPSSSTYATDVSNLTTSINTEQTSNNSMQSQIQGIIKALMTNAQQYEGSTKSAGSSIIKEKDYWVQQQKSS